MAFIEKDTEKAVLWKFKHITAHDGPFTSIHPNCKGSKYNVRIEWENGEITSKPAWSSHSRQPSS